MNKLGFAVSLLFFLMLASIMTVIIHWAFTSFKEGVHRTPAKSLVVETTPPSPSSIQTLASPINVPLPVDETVTEDILSEETTVSWATVSNQLLELERVRHTTLKLLSAEER